MFFKLGKSIDVKIWQLTEKVTGNCAVFTPRSHFVNEISKEPAACLSGKLSCNWLIMLVTMATPISSHVKDKNSTSLRAMKMWFFSKGKILVCHQYLYNKKNIIFFHVRLISLISRWHVTRLSHHSLNRAKPSPFSIQGRLWSPKKSLTWNLSILFAQTKKHF